jgi:hypothetical protein
LKVRDEQKAEISERLRRREEYEAQWEEKKRKELEDAIFKEMMSKFKY